MGRKLLKTVQTITTFQNHLADPWEPVADPLWSANPSLKTAELVWQAKITLGSSKLNCSRQYVIISTLLVLNNFIKNLFVKKSRDDSCEGRPRDNKGEQECILIFTARCYASAVLAMGQCPSVCVCV